MVLLSVRVIDDMTVKPVTLYRLEVNGETICEVAIDLPAWFPVKPRLNRSWLRPLVATALRNYFSRCQNVPDREVVKA